MPTLLSIDQLDEIVLKGLYRDTALSVLEPLIMKWRELYAEDFDSGFKLFSGRNAEPVSFDDLLSYCESTGEYYRISDVSIPNNVLREPVSENPLSYEEIVAFFRSVIEKHPFSVSDLSSNNSSYDIYLIRLPWKEGLSGDQILQISSSMRARSEEIIEKAKKQAAKELFESVKSQAKSKIVQVTPEGAEGVLIDSLSFKNLCLLVPACKVVSDLLTDYCLPMPNKNALMETIKSAFNSSLKNVGEYLNQFGFNAVLITKGTRREGKNKENKYRCMLSIPKGAYPVLFQAMTGTPDLFTTSIRVPEYGMIRFDDKELCTPRNDNAMHAKIGKIVKDTGTILYFHTGIWKKFEGCYYFYTVPFVDRDDNEPGVIPTLVSREEVAGLAEILKEKSNGRISLSYKTI